MFRFKQGVPVTADEKILHWHAFDIGTMPDGAMEEGSPMITVNGGNLRYSFTPDTSGLRWYHTHASSEKHLDRSTFTRPVRLRLRGTKA